MPKKMSEKHEKTLVIPIEKDMWKKLKKISFDQEVSMAELVRNAIEKIINKHK